ncbi:Dak1 domain-containing protein [Xylariomycetidae sp. FL0641]|nr:Dak1 domain-containing protein [Xylariomycetidae sp. FL0641]
MPTPSYHTLPPITSPSMSAKHFVNDPVALVDSALHSLTLTNPSVGLDSDNKIVYRRPNDAASQVSIISGGGSGHEPSFGAFVGRGLLAAAVAGTIFASPSAEQIRKAITGRVDASKGVLVTVMNYTGDVLNFGMAVEKAKAVGLNVEMLVVADDVGVGRAKGGKVGRRGIAGTVLVHKISGALAAQGASLDQVYKVARLTADNLVSVGASLEHVHVPGRAPPDPNAPGSLGRDEVEVGMGIHNEAGSGRAKVELPELVRTMMSQLLDQNDKDRAYLKVNSNEVVLLVNNLGGVSPLEMGGITAEVVKQLAEWGIKPVRILSGTYMTSLNGLGFSITLLNVVNTDIGGPSMIQLLDHPCEATGWAAPIAKETWEAKNFNTREAPTGSDETVKPSGLKADGAAFTEALSAGLNALIAAEPEVTRYDTVVGDGDCGIGLKRGAEAVLKQVKETKPTGDAVVDVASIVPVVETAMDGTSGALFAIFLNALVQSLRESGQGEATAQVWAGALKKSCNVLSSYTPARPGDRTIIDALYPFVEVLEKTGDVKKAAEAAKKAAEGTKGMQASLGRAVYVGGSGFQEVPDPGAWGLACFFLGLAGMKPNEEGWEAI